MLRFRASQLGNIMSDGRDSSITDKQLVTLSELEQKKKDKGITIKQQETLNVLIAKRDAPVELSKGAKKYIKGLAEEDIYDYVNSISSRELDKGITVEDDSIDLYNEVLGTFWSKNKERKENYWITGECDVEEVERITDIKSSWSLTTFPKLKEDIDSKLYEWQGRAYMWLYNKPSFRLAYCMVDTPLDLLNDWDNMDIHIVNEIDPTLRVTYVDFIRDCELEKKIIEKVELAREYYQKVKQEILNRL